MFMTVAQLIEKLMTYDLDAEILVLEMHEEPDCTNEAFPPAITRLENGTLVLSSEHLAHYAPYTHVHMH
jgi:hypothetical protein